VYKILCGYALSLNPDVLCAFFFVKIPKYGKYMEKNKPFGVPAP
jgi:hypothetical protein